MYIKSLNLNNFTCFKSADVSFASPVEATSQLPNVTLLLGDNGAGKSSLLKAVALSALAPVISQSGFVPVHLARKNSALGAVIAPSFWLGDDELYGLERVALRGETQVVKEGDIERLGFHEFMVQNPDESLSKPWWKQHLTDHEARTLAINREDLFTALAVLLGAASLGPKIGLTLPVAEFLAVYGKELTGLLGGESAERLEQETVSRNQFLINRLTKALTEEDIPQAFLLGYGPTRRMDTSDTFDPQQHRKNRTLRYQRVAGLFEDHLALVPLHAWLPRLDEARQQEVVELYNLLLPDSLRFHGEQERYEYLFEHEGGALPYSALSDGYRGYIGLLSDMMYHMSYVCPEERPLTELSGMILIDEIGLHLHPNWQRTVVPTLARVFPRMQFILTSHSPIVAGTLHPENIVVLEIEPSDEPDDPWPRCVPRRYEERIHGLNADQVLTSAYFGLDTTRSPDSVTQRRELLQRASGGDKDAALEFLESLTKGVTLDP